MASTDLAASARGQLTRLRALAAFGAFALAALVTSGGLAPSAGAQTGSPGSDAEGDGGPTAGSDGDAAPAPGEADGDEDLERAEDPRPLPSGPVNPDALVVPPPPKPDVRLPEEDVNRLLRAEHSILKASDDLDQAMARRTEELRLLQKQQEVVEKDLADTTREYKARSGKLDGARDLVRRRLRALIRLKKTKTYQMMLGAEQYAKYLRRKRALELLLREDQVRIARYRRQLDHWREATSDLQRRQTNLANTQGTIANVLQERDWDRREKQALLEAVRERRAFHSKYGQELGDVDQFLARKVKALAEDRRTRLWFEETRGKLQNPVRKGRVVGKFGNRRHDDFDTRTYHRGIHIVADPKLQDERVRAIYWGFVSHTGWIRGLGNTVILDHTRGYFSLYAHLDTIDVRVGDKVKTGSVVGMMGDTGSLHGRRLYLEIRRDGRAIDPRPWLK